MFLEGCTLAEFLANWIRLALIALVAITLVACGGQPEDDLDPEEVFAPNMTINDVAANEGETFVFTVAIEYSQGFEVSVDYTTINGSATAGSDFVAASGRLVIPADATSASITVVSSQDSLDEADEQFTVQLSTPTNATIVDANGVGSILDNDPRPTLSTSSLSVTEGQTARVAIVISQVSGRNISFNFATANATAVAPSDYTAVSGVATIPAGSLSTSINVVTANNLIPEPTETLTLNLNSVINADSGVLTSTITIVDDDAGQNPQVFVQDVSFTEPNSLVFNVTFNFASTIPMNFDYQTFNGSATQGLDFANTSGRVTVNAGLLSASVTVAGINDNIFEGTETLTLSLSNLVNLNAGDLIATGTILDDETMPNLFVLDSNSTEGGTLNFVVSLTGLSTQNITFNVASASGTATSGLDFGALAGARTIPALSGVITLAVAAVDDALDEDDETFNVNVASVVGATAVDNSGLGTITDNDNPPVISVGDISRLEGETLNFVVQIDAPSSKQIIFSFQTYNETAVAGPDFVAVSRQFTISAGNTSVLAPVVSVEDIIDESDETFAVSLGGLINAQAGDIGAQGSILNDDVPPDLQILNTVAVEGQTALFLVTMSQPNGVPVVFEYTTVNGTAVGPGDYQLASGIVTVPAMSQVYLLSVLTTDDSSVESDESFTVSVFNVSGANLIDGSGGAVIQDNDAAIFISDSSTNEGSTASFVVTLSKSVPQVSTFQYTTYAGTADAGVDYTTSSGTVTILSGSASVSVSVASIQDLLYEGSENFVVSLYGFSANLIPGDIQAVGTINDDDTPPEIFVSDASSIEGATALFTVTLSAGSVSPVAFNFSTLNQTAVAGSDFVATTGSQTFAPMQTALTIAVVGLDDVSEESNETMVLSLSSPLGGTIGRSAGVGTIQDNDATVFISDALASEGDTLSFMVTLSRSLPVNASFQYATQLSGSADVADFTPVSSTWVTIPTGQTQVTLSIQTTEDFMFESNETFGVTLSNLINLAAGDISAVGTINNDDSIPTIDVYDVAVSEGGSAQVKISLTGLTSDAVYFNFQSFSGTATSGIDFNTVSGNDSIAPGNDVRYIFVQTTNDNWFEGDENFVFSISAITNANPGDLTGAVTILDNDPQPRIFVTDAFAAEGATAQVTITLDSAHALATAFNYNTNGITAVDGVDFTDVGGTISLSPGQMTIVIGVPLTTDAAYEPDEAISFDLGGLVGLLAGDLNATVTILEASAPPNLVVYGDSQLESLQGTIVVSLSALSGRSATFHYQTLNQTAVSASDYVSASGVGTILAGQLQTSIVVSFTPDTTFESDETFVVSLSNIVDANPLNTFAQVTIVNDDPAPEIFISDASLSESGTTMTFVVTLGNAGTSDTTFCHVLCNRYTE